MRHRCGIEAANELKFFTVNGYFFQTGAANSALTIASRIGDANSFVI